jgi:hypothetical protein
VIGGDEVGELQPACESEETDPHAQRVEAPAIARTGQPIEDELSGGACGRLRDLGVLLCRVLGVAVEHCG